MKYLLVAIGTIFTVVPEHGFSEGTIIDSSEDKISLEDRAEALNTHKSEADSLDGYSDTADFLSGEISEYDGHDIELLTNMIMI